MAGSDSPGHLLSLKVMRVSRPTLASAWQPFYSSSQSFSAHSTASILSLQGNFPLPGHPKTLRDLTHTTELLTLPSAFGAIQFGETFSSCLCINNESNLDVEAVTMKVEMQTATSKVTLAELGGRDFKLFVGDTMENVVSHEIKELGQHVLGCSISYRLPLGIRHAPGPAEDPSDPSLQIVRKFYKFSVTNPLSVKTKVHPPKSPSALLSAEERGKIFLEVHVQNLTQDAIWFEKMEFEGVPDWAVVDANIYETGDGSKSVFSDSTSLMQPQDMRQYIYILTPTEPPAFFVPPVPGSVVPLGRLDISWRSSFGEPGRLLTSMLSRKVPLPPPLIPTQPASALPPHLKRNQPNSALAPNRPQSPQSQPSPRPGTPPQRPGSPFGRNRVPQSPAAVAPTTFVAPSAPNLPPPPSDIELDLIFDKFDKETIKVEKPFDITFSLIVAALVPKSSRKRVLSVAVQHVQSARLIPIPAPDFPDFNESVTPRVPSSGVSTPSSTSARLGRGTFNYALAHQKLLIAEPRSIATTPDDAESKPLRDALPPPFAEHEHEHEHEHETKNAQPNDVVFLGSSTTFLDQIELSRKSDEPSSSDESDGSEDGKRDKGDLAHATRKFTFSYLPLRCGFQTVGGLRVILVSDKTVDESASGALVDPSELEDDDSRTIREAEREIRVLKEWEAVGEIWVASPSFEP